MSNNRLKGTVTMKYCSTCRIGRLRERLMTYVEWQERSLLVASNMPALVCDVCGEQAYDDHAIEDLQRLLLSKIPERFGSISNLSNR